MENHNNIVMLARSKLNSIESTISKVLIENEIGHEVFTTIINKERSYRELKKSIRMTKSQRSDIVRNKLIEDGERIDVDKIIRQN